jgi:hypothetical protein
MSDTEQTPDPPDSDPVKEDFASKDDYPRTLAELLEKFSTKRNPKKEK